MSEAFEDYGRELYVEPGRFCSNKDSSTVHMHPHYELSFFLHPQLVQSLISQTPYTVDYPHAILVAPFIPHFTTPKEYNGAYDRCVIYFDSYIFSSRRFTTQPEELLHGSTAVIFNLSGRAMLFEHTLNVLLQLRTTAEREKALDLLLYLLKKNPQPPLVTKSIPESYIPEVIAHVMSTIRDKCTVEDLSRSFAVSPDKLRRDFQKTTGMSIGKFVQFMKLNKAKRMLEDPQMTVADIVEQCGYESESYFYRLFKKETGYTPNDYKKFRS